MTNNDKEIELGDTVKDIYTGFEGIVMASTLFINGCIQFSVVAAWNPKVPIPEQVDMSIDSQSLKVIKRGKIYKDKQKQKKEDEKEDEEPTGGPSRRAFRQRGY